MPVSRENCAPASLVYNLDCMPQYSESDCVLPDHLLDRSPAVGRDRLVPMSNKNNGEGHAL